MYTPYTNLIVDTDKLFTRYYNEKMLSGASHRLKKECDEAKRRLDRAKMDLDHAVKNRYAMPAGWYEVDIAKRRVTKCECELQSIYNRLRSQLYKDKGKRDKDRRSGENI